VAICFPYNKLRKTSFDLIPSLSTDSWRKGCQLSDNSSPMKPVLLLLLLWTHGPCVLLKPVILLHSFLLVVRRTASDIAQSHQSVMSSSASVPWCRSPWNTPSIAIFNNHSSFILQMCPNNFTFLNCFINSTMSCCLSTLSLSLIVLLLTFPFQQIFNILQ